MSAYRCQLGPPADEKMRAESGARGRELDSKGKVSQKEAVYVVHIEQEAGRQRLLSRWPWVVCIVRVLMIKTIAD